MERLGGFLVFFGVGSAVMQLIGYDFRLLFWIETWGPGPAWGIRGALVLIGLVLVMVGIGRSEPAQAVYPVGPPGYAPQGPPAHPPQGQPGYPPQGQPGYPPQGQVGYPPQGQPGYPPQGQPPSTPFG